jgi:hypothetical protein
MGIQNPGKRGVAGRPAALPADAIEIGGEIEGSLHVSPLSDMGGLRRPARSNIRNAH